MMNIRFVSRLLIRFGIALLIVETLSRIMHWPLGDTLSTIGWFGTAAWVLLFAFQIQKSSSFAHGNSIKPEENRRASADKENPNS